MKKEWKAPEISCLNVKDTNYWSTGTGDDTWTAADTGGMDVTGRSSGATGAEDIRDW